ncbi:DUF262 domain-containing protein [Gimesia chilikensis]|uniref:GmrSD restriction endonucleases N-terminal domain-containing protein n=1 Tax=Gimesia chilikensis TaxID=2605989 RepID=A0A517PPW5_9PLAN|nr:DUF262 domain-containing protein [Gimesia chilikensis]QDT21415.1 hypothetical protein HG66A1_32160 [Gimesia chilikensis]
MSNLENNIDKKQDDSLAPPDIGELEGLDEDSDLGDFPIDTLLIRNETRSTFEVMRRIEAGGYIMNPDFQRDFIWDKVKQSKLIESVIMRIPLPVFYLAENLEGKVIVVDGLQRLSTFKSFLDNEFPLKLPEQELLDGKRFKDLSNKLQNRIEDSQLILYILDADVPDHAKFQIFERVNGGVPLTRQQMRNCLYNGPATVWLKEEAKTELFLEATGNSLDSKKMRDREFINRFCAFHLLGYDNYNKSDMDGFLARALQQMNEMSDEELKELSIKFRLSMRNNLSLFGRHAFRKHTLGSESRSVINASLWDVMSTTLARYSLKQVDNKADIIHKDFYPLLSNDKFNDAITYSPNSTIKVKRRFALVEMLFKEALGDYTN